MSSFDNTEDIIDVRDIIEAYEAAAESGEPNEDGSYEDESLAILLSELKGNGGDEKWEGDWYPVTLIRDSYFVSYAQELAEDIGAVPSEYTWPTSCIDWEKAAWELRMDYTSVDYQGITYWYR